MKAGLGQAWSWCLGKLRGACRLVRCGCSGLWRFRRTCLVALAVGAAVGAGSYLAGPVTSSVLCAASGATLTLASLVLLPLARLLLGSGPPGA